MMKESKKERLEYKLEALKCTGNVLEEYSLDRFSEIWQIAQPDLSKVCIYSVYRQFLHPCTYIKTIHCFLADLSSKCSHISNSGKQLEQYLFKKRHFYQILYI